VLFAVLWAVAQVLAWPLWARASLAGLAAAAALVVPELRARFQQDDTQAALVERAVTVPGGPARLPLVREAGLAQLRVHAAQVQVPYVQRDAEQTVADALGPGRAVLLVGHSMAGKTRLAAQVVHQRFPDAPLLVPESGQALRELVDEGLDPAGVVVWLDDLERFLGPDGLTVGLLARLTRNKAILVATIRSQAREAYRPRNELRGLPLVAWRHRAFRGGAMVRQYRKFDEDFKSGAVRLVFETGRPIAQVARDLGVNEGTLGNWVAAARRAGDGDRGTLNEDERAELARLRKENAELRMQRDVLKRSVALWVTEAMGR
jgi:transposase